MRVPVNVLSVMDEAAEQLNSVYSADDLRKSLVEARAEVAELIDAVSDVYGEPLSVPCPADPQCQSCRIQAAIASAKGGAE